MRSYIFPSIVMLTALALAAGAALFTVIGFRELFQPTFNVTYMAATIEFGKIIAVSVLYQLREVLGIKVKAFLFVMVLGAMAVTSMGVYGYLSSSFQRDTLSITQNESKLELLEDRKTKLEQRLEGMDAQIAEVPETYVTKRMELIETFKPERQAIITEIEELDDRKLALTLERVEKETEFGAIILLAKSVEWLDEEQAMLYFIVLVIFIFDPLAIALTHSANVAFAKAAKTRDEQAEAERELINLEGYDANEIMEKVNSAISNVKEDQEESNKSLAEALNNIASELNTLKDRKPVNPRADVMDSMRKQRT